MDFDPGILRRYFSGNYSRNDFKKIQVWFSDYSSRAVLRKYFEDHWLEFEDSGDTPNAGQMFDRIMQGITLAEIEQQRKSFLMIFQRVAAILIVPVTLAFFVLLVLFSQRSETTDAWAEIQCPLGVRTAFKLPDGTTGFLNSGSRLKYPVEFQGRREVSILGEACFQVTKDKRLPFVVSTGNMEVVVLGTRFNVVAYGDEKQEEGILNEGRVEIRLPGREPFAVLEPDQKLILNTETRSFSKLGVEAAQYTGWTEGKLVFRNEQMQQVAARMGRWYNADIEIADQELLKYAFRATFIDEPLEEVLKLLALTAPITWKEEPRKTSEDHTFQKRKIIVTLDKKRVNAFN